MQTIDFLKTCFTEHLRISSSIFRNFFPGFFFNFFDFFDFFEFESQKPVGFQNRRWSVLSVFAKTDRFLSVFETVGGSRRGVGMGGEEGVGRWRGWGRRRVRDLDL